MNPSTHISNHNTISRYWQCQLLGWGTVSIYWAYTVYTRDHYGVFFTLLNYLLDIAIGIALTHLYRHIAKKYQWSALPLGQLALRVIPSIILLSVAYTELVDIKWHLYWVYIENKDYTLWYSLSYWDPVFITGLRLMAIWILAYHLYHYHKNRLETAEQNATLLVVAKQAQLDNLSKQLNPHFLFNALNSIKSLVIENPKMARRAVDLLSDILRTSLYEKEAPFITLQEELDLVKDYVALEKIRFEERLNVTITMDDGLENNHILPLSIQLLVENAIKHGIDKHINGGEIHLSINKTTDHLKIIVQNPGQIAVKTPETGIGMENLTKRLQLYYEGAAQFKLENMEPNLVQATLIIPIQNQ